MLEIWQQLVQEWPFLSPLADAILIIIPLGCLLSYSGLFFISCTAAIISQSRKRASFKKCARQLAFSGFTLGWLLLIGGRVWLYLTAPERDTGNLESYMLEISWLLLSIGVLLSTIYLFLWNALKNMPVLHVTIGMIAAVQNCIALVCILFTIRISAAFAASPAKALSLPEIFPNAWNAPLWTAAFYTIPLLFALAGGFGSCWLAFRRKRDDFGRDHYNTMIPWCASWAKNSWAILLLLLIFSTSWQIWTSIENNAFNEQATIYECCFLLLWLIPELLWFIVQKSKMPLRNRWLLYLAFPVAISFVLPWFMDFTLIQI